MTREIVISHTWDLTGEQWREQITLALAVRREEAARLDEELDEIAERARRFRAISRGRGLSQAEYEESYSDITKLIEYVDGKRH